MQALSMMVVISGSRCDLLQSCLAPPYRLSSSHEGRKASRRSKGWCMSLVKTENLRLAGLTGTRISHRNLRKFVHQGYTPCFTGSCSSIAGPELGAPFRKTLVTSNPKGRVGKRNQVRVEKSWVNCYANGVSGEIHKKESGSRGRGVKHSGPLERTVSSKDGWALDTGEVGEQGSSGQVNQAYGGVLGNEISNSEYQKIQDLKFSGDMWEGDSGPQVLDLQRALYWFGYLPKRTELTAYFGPGTKRALQQFQIAHGVPGTGAWGSSSRQGLWKLLSEQSFSFSEGESSVHSDVQQLGSTLVNKINVGGKGVGIRVSELMNNMGAHSRGFMSTLSSAPCWRNLPTNVPRNAAMFGLLVGVLAALFGLGYSLVGMFHGQHGQPVRRRVFRAHWRDDLSGTASTKPRRHLDLFPGLDLPVVGEEDFKYRLRSKSRSSTTNSTGRTDRLILYGGQVFVGDEAPSSVYPFMNGPASRRGSGKTATQGPSRARTSSIHVQASTNQVGEKPASNGSVSGSGSREENHQGGQVSPKRISNVRNRGENQSITRVDSDAVGSTSSRPIQNLSPRSIRMEQSIEKQPNFVRNLLSALFTPKGLGNSTGLEKHERQRIGSNSMQMGARSTEKQVLVDSETESKMSKISKSGRNDWQDKDEENFKDRVEELRNAVQATEKNRQAAMRALAEERQRSLELQVKISRQKETAAALEEEVRVLKESHDALLASLRKKYSSSVAARAAAALLYQNWDTNYEEGSPQTLSY